MSFMFVLEKDAVSRHPSRPQLLGGEEYVIQIDFQWHHGLVL